MKININDQLEQAHEDYEAEKVGILADLFSINSVLLDLCILDEPISTEACSQISKIIARTAKFITEGERI